MPNLGKTFGFQNVWDFRIANKALWTWPHLSSLRVISNVLLIIKMLFQHKMLFYSLAQQH